jgi:ubiquinone/menaquinone biosynthesis C-methylase UbiE
MQTALRFPFLERRFTPRSVFMDIGSADCALALQAASYVERVYAIDVSGRFLQSVLMPLNLRLVLCGGVRIPVPEASVDVAFSGGFIDQLHPDDAAEHLKSVLRTLAAGGAYLCKTNFPTELRKAMRAAGFGTVACYACAVRVPWVLAELVPAHLRRIVATR